MGQREIKTGDILILTNRKGYIIVEDFFNGGQNFNATSYLFKTGRCEADHYSVNQIGKHFEHAHKLMRIFYGVK